MCSIGFATHPTPLRGENGMGCVVCQSDHRKHGRMDNEVGQEVVLEVIIGLLKNVHNIVSICDLVCKYAHNAAKMVVNIIKMLKKDG